MIGHVPAGTRGQEYPPQDTGPQDTREGCPYISNPSVCILRWLSTHETGEHMAGDHLPDSRQQDTHVQDSRRPDTREGCPYISTPVLLYNVVSTHQATACRGATGRPQESLLHFPHPTFLHVM